MATVSVTGAVVVGCGVSSTTIYPLNGAMQAYVISCRAQVAHEQGLSVSLRGALEANCAHPDTTAVAKAVTLGCPQLIGALGVSAADNRQLVSSCAQGNNPASLNRTIEHTCRQTVRNTVPRALRARALATCAKP